MKGIAKMFTLTALAVVCWSFVVSPVCAGSGSDKSTSRTLANLMAAYDGESNARAKYLEYAKKADAEGYGKIASLFRAAAKAEEVHAEQHAQIIKDLGGTPKADVKLPEIKSTTENLKAALAGETQESTTMYPEYIKAARAEKVKDAVKAFSMAKASEAEHARLYQLALDNQEQWKGGASDWYVCLTCGWTAEKLPDVCPICFQPKDKYVKVS